MAESDTKLVEGVDYTLEDGLFVLSRDYLLRRGHCCNSGCRNCPYPPKGPRIISMVPSWTEMLISAGVNVVGRTRYCIHPSGVTAIPTVGGTKDIDWAKALEQRPDYILLDREENPEHMGRDSSVPVLATHVSSIHDMPRELAKIVALFDPDDKCAQKLRIISDRWKLVLGQMIRPLAWQDLPGVMRWLRAPKQSTFTTVAYVIWRKPWMAVAEHTFIASMLHRSGYPRPLWPSRASLKASDGYPVFEPQQLPVGSLVLLSSEPYPFALKSEGVLDAFPQAGGVALVDGESFSWFGLRALEFLERQTNRMPTDLV